MESRTQGETADPGSRLFYLLILSCFFLSGAAGLIYEVVWARQLSLFLGITSFAHTAVITAYMAGLAAGSVFFGRRADKGRSPLRTYAWLEIGVGLYAAMTPWMFDVLQAAYANAAGVAGVSGMSSHMTRFAIALSALLLPTFLMGGTLPLLVRGFVHDLPELGKATSRLYGLNTLGAMTGTLIAGYFLIPSFGIVVSTFSGVILNLGIAVLVLFLLRSMPVHRTTDPGQPATAEPDAPTGAEKPVPGATRAAAAIDTRFAILIGFGLAGFAALLTQMAWIRALILVIGGSVYAFTVTLASFLAGIGLGSLAYARFLSSARGRTGEPLLSMRMTQAAVLSFFIAVTMLLGLAVIGKLPGWFLQGYAAGLHENFVQFQLFIFALCFSLMILPTLFMGALFPLITVVWTRDLGRAGRGVGTAYAINTTGTIFGALLGGLVILPWLGVHKGIELTTAIYAFVAVLFWLAASNAFRPLTRAVGVLAVIVVIAGTRQFVPPWDMSLMSSGVFYRPSNNLERIEQEAQGEASQEQLLYYAEGLDGTVTVKMIGDTRFLAINGKTDASSQGDIPTQVLLGRLPMQLDRDIESVLNIGLGSGITAGTMAASESIRDMTVLEISAEVVVASNFFAPENYRVLTDPRVQLVTADARNYLMATDRQFDLIVSEPSNPWISGVSNLFTAEFFDLAKRHLAPGGVMTQWFHIYSMSTEDMKIILRTFASRFAHVSAWQSLPGDLIIMGSDEPYALRLGRRDGSDVVNDRELDRARIFRDRDLVRLNVFTSEALKQYSQDAILNTDAWPVIEFSAPRNLYADTFGPNMEDIFSFLGGRNEPVPVKGFYRLLQDRIDVSALDLEISLPQDAVPSDISGEWIVDKSLQEQNGEAVFKVASERVVTWREDQAGFRVQGSWFRERLAAEELLEYLRSQMDAGDLESGEMTMEAGYDGVWVSGPGNPGDSITLWLAWECPSKIGGFTRFVAQKTMLVSEQAGREDYLAILAGRFTCTLKTANTGAANTGSE